MGAIVDYNDMLKRQSKKPEKIKYTVIVRDDNSIDISGPVENFFLFRDIMSQAERGILDLHMHLFEETINQSDIISPSGAEVLAFNKNLH